MPAKILEVSGSPYNQGRQQGVACPDAIRSNLTQIKDLVRSLPSDTSGQYQTLLQANQEYVNTTSPDILAECQGLAEGADLPLDDVVLMNMPIYVVLRRSNLVEECSVFVVGSDQTSDHHSYLVKTRDQPVNQFQFEHIVLHRLYEDGHRVIEVNAAGIVTNPGSGVNDQGLALGTAGVWSADRLTVRASRFGSAEAMPNTHFLLREARSVDDVIGLLEQTKDRPRLAGMNFLAADRSGAVATIEATSEGALATAAPAGIACITNHYLDPGLAKRGPQRSENLSSYLRRERILNMLGSMSATVGFTDLLKIAVDHENGPQGSVCRHSDGKSGSATRYVSLAVVDQREIWTFIGHPCEVALISRVDGN